MAWPFLAGLVLAGAGAPAPPPDSLQDLTIEQLAGIEVVSAGKRLEPLSQAPVSLFVITSEDIARSTGTSLPEILRLAPSLDVQRIDARQYAVTARGFQGYDTANKLLVQIDGRSIYSTLSSGVFWDLFETPLEDIERIEVISGPGGTLYGANAVNGVISIISKDARDTQGLIGRATSGSQEKTALLRYGLPIGTDGGVRVYVQGYDREGFPSSGRRRLNDGGTGWQTGFRADLGGERDIVTLQGDIFDHDNDSGARDRDDGQNILGRWTHATGDGASTMVQGYYSRFARRFGKVYDRLEMVDLAVQHNRTAGRHALVVGGGVRLNRDRFVNGTANFTLNSPDRSLWIYNAFLQDRIDLGANLALTAGLQAEKSTALDVRWLPSARLGWSPKPDMLFWANVARAVRQPSRIDRQLVQPGVQQPGGFRTEDLTSMEIGYRGRPTRNIWLSATVFYSLYDRLRTTKSSPISGRPDVGGNDLRGDQWGIEASASLQIAPWWRMTAGLATLDKDFELRKEGTGGPVSFASLGNDPDYHASLGSRIDLTPAIGLDVQLRRYGARPDPRVPAYFDADVRLGWRVADQLELYISGVNILHDRRPESEDRTRGQLVRRLISVGARFGL